MWESYADKYGGGPACSSEITMEQISVVGQRRQFVQVQDEIMEWKKKYKFSMVWFRPFPNRECEMTDVNENCNANASHVGTLSPHDYLPPELWFKIFILLPVRSKCQLAMVCRDFGDIASQPNTWTRVNINKERTKRGDLKDIFVIGRFQKIQSIDLSGCYWISSGGITDFLGCIPSTVTSLDLAGIDLSLVDNQLLTQVCSRRTRMGLKKTGISTEQCSEILKEIQDSSLLQELDMSGVVISHVDRHLLASSISKLSKANLSSSCLTTEQLTSLLSSIHSSSCLQQLTLDSNQLRVVPSLVVAQGVLAVPVVSLAKTKLTVAQCSAILNHIALPDVALVELNLSQVHNLSQVPVELLQHVLKSGLVGLSPSPIPQDLKPLVKKSSSGAVTIKLDWSLWTKCVMRSP